MSVGLENKAKFLHEFLYPITLYDKCKGCNKHRYPYANCAHYFSGFCQKTAKDKLVPLVDAQKEIQRLKDENIRLNFEVTLPPSFFRAKCKILTYEDKKLRAKVEAASKIVAEICKNCLDEKCTWGTACHIYDLKAMLEIPRKEKCRVGGVPQNVPSCKELESDEFHDCQGYTSKIVKKENKQK